MKKNRYEVGILTRALNFLNAYEIHKKSDSVSFPTQESFIISDVDCLMIRLKSYLGNVDNLVEKQNVIEVYRVITEIAFDELEKDVTGVN